MGAPHGRRPGRRPPPDPPPGVDRVEPGPASGARRRAGRAGRRRGDAGRAPGPGGGHPLRRRQAGAGGPRGGAVHRRVSPGVPPRCGRPDRPGRHHPGAQRAPRPGDPGPGAGAVRPAHGPAGQRHPGPAGRAGSRPGPGSGHRRDGAGRRRLHRRRPDRVAPGGHAAGRPRRHGLPAPGPGRHRGRGRPGRPGDTPNPRMQLDIAISSCFHGDHREGAGPEQGRSEQP